jgi:hypothetical protein
VEQPAAVYEVKAARRGAIDADIMALFAATATKFYRLE